MQCDALFYFHVSIYSIVSQVAFQGLHVSLTSPFESWQLMEERLQIQSSSLPVDIKEWIIGDFDFPWFAT